MNHLIVTPTALFFAVALVTVAFFISLKEKIGLEKDLVIGVIRAVIQLTIVGYVLTYIISVNRAWLTLLMVAIIVFNAAWNARGRARGIPHAFVISLLAVATGVTIGLLVLAKAIAFVPSQIVPVSGMIASNAMVAIGLTYRSLNSQFHDQRQGLLERLALGATRYQTAITVVREAIRTGMSPTIDSAKTVGIVSLPGMMSGLIFAGVDPTKAIMYQIMVTFMLMAATSIGSTISCYLAYPQFFNGNMQLRTPHS
ncbi:iron export ABC transporter permease subunit FetB [Lacticaseibacillus paracasei]|uniref:ABC transporter permease n=1 Tax=Lacticaseibacillus paracasei TaxID=1597 RepID=UPI00194E0EF5|nr:iron export ABC transporter permease subunit FetB [Lacticaseibacillus paracasei]MBM6642415.1 iron export ABC transporter permease subunit FetB [Lacticaseibacillus paracasei]